MEKKTKKFAVGTGLAGVLAFYVGLSDKLDLGELDDPWKALVAGLIIAAAVVILALRRSH